MERTHHLAELSSLIAAIRAQGRTARLVVRNVDRLGLIHLYFADGRLLHVEGHVGNPMLALRDLASWYHGAVRIDATTAAPAVSAPAEPLDAALTQTLAELETRGVVRPAPPSIAPSAASAFHAALSRPSVPSVPSVPGVPNIPRAANTPPRLPPVSGPPAGSAGLPPLAGAAPVLMRGGITGTLDAARQPEPGALTDPQWHLLALAARQIVEQVGRMVGVRMADTMFRDALGRSARHDRFLASLEIDASGWLRARQDGSIARESRDDVAESIADLITHFETQCADIMGEQRAHELIAGAVMPMRASLEQIGLTIKTN